MEQCNYGQGGITALRVGVGSAIATPTVDTVASVLADCMSATANIEGLLMRIDAKLFGERPEVAQDICKTATEPPIESRCLGLRTRLRALVQSLETLSDKL